MKAGRIALFEMDGLAPTQWLIALATRSRITHAAIEVDGRWYDASESRGNFGPLAADKFQDRHCYVIEADISAGWLPMLKGCEYDWKGVFTWLVGRWVNRDLGDASRFYCFEAAYLAMTGNDAAGAVSGADLLDLAYEYEMPIYYGTLAELEDVLRLKKNVGPSYR